LTPCGAEPKICIDNLVRPGGVDLTRAGPWNLGVTGVINDG
jgi:hypothetical protein